MILESILTLIVFSPFLLIGANTVLLYRRRKQLHAEAAAEGSQEASDEEINEMLFAQKDRLMFRAELDEAYDSSRTSSLVTSVTREK